MQISVLKLTTSTLPWTIGESSTLTCDASLAANYDGVTIYRRYEDQAPEVFFRYIKAEKKGYRYLSGAIGKYVSLFLKSLWHLLQISVTCDLVVIKRFWTQPVKIPKYTTDDMYER